MNKILDIDLFIFRTRLQPIFILLLPLGLIILSWINLGQFSVTSSLPLLGMIGIPFLLSQIGRDLGKYKETNLWNTWGGKPTNLKLQHASQLSNPVTLKRRHLQLSKLIGHDLPTPAQEKIDINAANEIYDSCIELLKSRTRDKKQYPLVYLENLNYGFRRNLWAMRPFGIFGATCGITLTGLPTIIFFYNDSLPSAALVSLVANITLLILWIFKFNSEWVKVPAFAYAERLLEACDSLSNANGG